MPVDQQVSVVPDYYRGHKTADELAEARNSDPVSGDNEKANGGEGGNVMSTVNNDDDENGESSEKAAHNGVKKPVPAAWVTTFDKVWYQKPQDGKWFHPKNLPASIVKGLMHGVDKDVVYEQQKKSFLSGDLERVHARAPHFENKTEHLYSFLQVLTAATASFAHGSNDVANAMGPLSTIYYVWKNDNLKTKLSVPIWVL